MESNAKDFNWDYVGHVEIEKEIYSYGTLRFDETKAKFDNLPEDIGRLSGEDGKKKFPPYTGKLKI